MRDDRQTDVLVIGAGAAGCACAIQAADLGLDVTMICHLEKAEDGSNTSWAQGGIASCGEGDSTSLFTKDILQAGVEIGNDKAIGQLVTRGPEVVKALLLERCKVPFDQDKEGALHYTREAAHSCRRILHVGDATGQVIANHLLKEVRAHSKIRLVENATAIDLIMREHHTQNPMDVYRRRRCLGAYVLLDGSRVEPFVAAETVLATGGAGQVFLHSTNPLRARGDGLAMAYRVGARVVQLEYIQFHPTAFYHRHAPRFLITEAVRGEGGVLLDAKGRSFMEKYDAKKELAPRDIVARALHHEMMEQGEPSMFLDISHKPAGWIHQHFPTVTAMCEEYQVDVTSEPIPVVPAAHYFCGGVSVDLQAKTEIAGLRAVGEVSCTGIHGANRLASTSLLEAVTWGYEAATNMASQMVSQKRPDTSQIADWKMETDDFDPALIHQDWMTIKYTMWNYVGLVRTTKRLNRALKILRELQFEVEEFYRQAFPADAVIGLRNGIQTALAITHAAYRNRESRGGHFRLME